MRELCTYVETGMDRQYCPPVRVIRQLLAALLSVTSAEGRRLQVCYYRAVGSVDARTVCNVLDAEVGTYDGADFRGANISKVRT